MRTIDLSPLLRLSVGFDSLSRALDSAMRLDESDLSYPPYNIEKLGDNEYGITMAVAGFSETDLEITSQQGLLTVRGRLSREADGGNYLHRGIAGRAFERKFQLADYVEVTGARLANGLLHIALRREVPEAMKPKTIAITAGAAPKQIADKAA